MATDPTTPARRQFSIGIGSATIVLVAVAVGLHVTRPKLYLDSELDVIHEKFGEKAGPDLKIVPNGETMKLKRIFEQLGLDPKRLGKPHVGQEMMVKFHTWRVSPGYQLSIMVATNDPNNDFSDLWNLNGYGVRIVRN